MIAPARGHPWFLFAAALIVAFVVDLPRLVIEIFNLPLPRLGGNPPYLILPALALIGAYLHLRGVRRTGEAIEPAELVFIGALVLCGLVEIFHWISGKQPDLRLVTEALWWFVAYYLVKQHLLASRAHAEFVRVALVLLAAIGLLHLAALGAAAMGWITSAHVLAEIRGRNGISLLLAGALYLYWFCLPAQIRRPWHTASLLSLTLVHAVANQARGALLALTVLLIARLAWDRQPVRTLGLAVLAAAVALGAAAISFGYPSFARESWLSELAVVRSDPAATDHERSVVYRLAANSYLVGRIAESPVLGIGASEAAGERAGGYPSHTYYLMFLAAYGLVGFLAYIVAMGMVFFAPEEIRRPSAAVLVLLLVTILSFVNDLHAWLAMLAAVATAGGQMPRAPSPKLAYRGAGR